jgi:hypothetical protein
MSTTTAGNSHDCDQITPAKPRGGVIDPEDNSTGVAPGRPLVRRRSPVRAAPAVASALLAVRYSS